MGTEVFANRRRGELPRVFLVAAALLLISVFVVGLGSLATSPLEVVTLSLAYTSGLSMIVLPCTLPAVFVIVPLSLGRGYRRGLTMALLFGLGLTLTIGAYGVAVASLGRSSTWIGSRCSCGSRPGSPPTSSACRSWG